MEKSKDNLKITSKVADILSIYMSRTNLSWYETKCFILKNQKALELFEEPYITCADEHDTATALIAITLFKKVDSSDIYSKIERDEELIRMITGDKFKYLVPCDILDKIKSEVENLNKG